jgi:hypothetical protein
MTTASNSTESIPLPVSLRWFALFGGTALIGTATYANVLASGGLSADMAPALIAHAVGLGIGAACVGASIRSKRYFLAFMISTALIIGEAYTFLNTGERELESRELRQAPNKLADAKRKAIEAEIAKAEAALAGLTSHRVSQAEQVLARVEESTIQASTQKDCWKMCKARLDDSVEGARRELQTARAELAAERAGIVAKVEGFKAEIAAIPVVAALSPLAARIGVPDWKLDLTRAGLFTVSANGLGGLLVLFFGHGGGRRRVIEAAKVEAAPVETPKMLSFENPNGDRPSEEIEELKKLYGRVVELLAKAEEMNNQELAHAVGVSPGHMSRERQKLEAAGFLTSAKVGKEMRIRLAASNGKIAA